MDGGGVLVRHGDAAWVTPLLRCPVCGDGGLARCGAALACGGCGNTYPERGGVPVLMADVIEAEANGLAWDAARARLGPGADPVAVLRVRHSTSQGVRSVLDVAPAEREGVTWLLDHVPRAMRPGSVRTAAIQMRNDGAALLSIGRGRATLAACWTTLDGRPAGEWRTPIGEDVAPGQVSVLPLELHAPPDAGRYKLRIHLVQEGVRWLEPAAGPFLVAVSAGIEDRPPAERRPPPADRPLGRIVLIEAARGSPAPEAVRVGADLVELQVGAATESDVAAVYAAPHAPPLAAAAFDAVFAGPAVQASAEPVRTLLHYRRLLRKGGFIAVETGGSGPLGGADLMRLGRQAGLAVAASYGATIRFAAEADHA